MPHLAHADGSVNICIQTYIHIYIYIYIYIYTYIYIYICMLMILYIYIYIYVYIRGKIASVCDSTCDTIDGIHFCGCGCQSENPFVCFGAKTTQRACAPDLPWDRKDQGRKVPGNSQQKGAEEDSRQERSVKRSMRSAEGSRRDQLTKEGRRRQSGDESRAEKREDQKSKRRLLRPVKLKRTG